MTTPVSKPQIWQGSHEAAHPVWASDQGFECVLTIADPRFPDKKLGWLDDDGDIDHLRVEAEVYTGETLACVSYEVVSESESVIVRHTEEKQL